MDARSIINKDLIAEYKRHACEVCGQQMGHIDAHHHLKSRGVNSPRLDVPENLTSLCRWECHRLIHSTNRGQFIYEIVIDPCSKLPKDPEELYIYLTTLKDGLTVEDILQKYGGEE